MDINQWVRANKKRIARELLASLGHAKQAQPSAVFTAGLPGSGKTEFTTELVSGLAAKPLRIDMDELAEKIEGYNPQLADLFRKGASDILTELYTKTLREQIDFIFDGTLAHGHAILNIERAIKHGYMVKIYYIHQQPEIAWQFTKDRELVEKRGIKKSGFIDTYCSLYDNLRLLQKSGLPITLSVVIKDADNKVVAQHEDVSDIFELIDPVLSRAELESVIID